MSKKVLLADDSPTVLVALQQLLKGRGLELLTAKDGQQAVALAISQRPALILMDVTMPELDGLEATRRLRQVQELRHTPIILVTARGEPVDMLEGFKAGCDLYITKPFNSMQLLGLVNGFLARETVRGTWRPEPVEVSTPTPRRPGTLPSV